jgi:hypothetical protein
MELLIMQFSPTFLHLIGPPAWPRSYRVEAHKQTCVCPHGKEVHARKWTLYAPTQDTALHGLTSYSETVQFI